MSADCSWQEGNARHLSRVVAWLRLRLTDLATLPDHEQALDAAAPVPGMSADELEHEISLCESEIDPPPALVQLTHSFGLQKGECELLMLCVAMELDTRIPPLCARAQDAGAGAHPTFALALRLFPDLTWEAIAPTGRLRSLRLVDIHSSPGRPVLTSPLTTDERVVDFARGLNYIDPRVSPHLTPVRADLEATALQPSQRKGVDAAIKAWHLAAADGTAPLFQVLGVDTATRDHVAVCIAACFKCTLHRLANETRAGPQVELDTIAQLWARECLLQRVALLIEIGDAPAATTPITSFARRLAQGGNLVVLTSRELVASLGRESVLVDAAKPTSGEQRDAWDAALGQRAGRNPALLSAQFDLDISTLRRLASVTKATRRDDDGSAFEGALWDACRRAARPAMEGLARAVDVRASWSDIVLPPEQLDTLRQVSAQVRSRSRVYGDWGFGARMNRGLGISALFEGASGVGKTMAAEVLASDLRLDLYRIDLSTVVSKYIGETESNLRRVFDAADNGGIILFFDEADALFSSRSEVKDSHDRYANIETNYLLQRIEAYRGLAILATNMKGALDAAFMRRLRFVIEFPFPGAKERAEIWRMAFPLEVPVDDLDVERLGRLNLAGGSIHSAALRAAFLAAHLGTAVDMDCVLRAVRAEFTKLGRPFTEGVSR